jgi:UDP-N-acetylglucosamine 2-epimerase (non-hydrolysing)
MKILHVVGARPNFMKVAPVMSALARRNSCTQILVHTGQHYDVNMSDIFFQQLSIPSPDYNLEVGSSSHAIQTAEIMMRFEPVVLEQRPDLVLVYGDVNSTVAAALVCAKLLIPLGHVEAGLRSFDRTMPEEINRIVTDRLADLLFTPSIDGNENLAREGVDPRKIHLVGNVMIDTLVRMLPMANGEEIIQHLALDGRRFVLVTLHRPSNVDDPRQLKEILLALSEISTAAGVVFPLHPRTSQVLERMPELNLSQSLQLIDPVGYLEFLGLQRKASLVITDSGGIQEETTYLGIPCLTLRENTERPVTVSVGRNILIGHNMPLMKSEAAKALSGNGKCGSIPPLWDGAASERIADKISDNSWRF